MEIKIRKATIKDLKEVQKFIFLLLDKERIEYSKYLNPKWATSKKGKKFYLERISKKDKCVFIARVNTKPIGVICGGITKPEEYRALPKSAELEDLFVLEKYRNQKVGLRLYQTFLNWCKKNKVKAIRVDMAAKNLKGIKFYKKQGFQDMVLTMENYL